MPEKRICLVVNLLLPSFEMYRKKEKEIVCCMSPPGNEVHKAFRPPGIPPCAVPARVFISETPRRP